MIPVGLAAGFIKMPGHVTDDLQRSAADFITLGAVTEDPREGNPEPREARWEDHPDGEAYINALNLPNAGVHATRDFLPELLRKVKNVGKTLRVNVTPTRSGGTKHILQVLGRSPLHAEVERYEINLACPNHREGNDLHPVLAFDVKAVEDILVQVAESEMKGEIGIKIAPDMPEGTLRKICDLAAVFDITWITSGNTRRIEVPMIDGRRPLHSSIAYCGLSGTPLYESNLKQVRFLTEYIRQRGCAIKVSACGGVMDGLKVSRYQDAGASECQVAAAYAIYGPKIFSEIAVVYGELDFMANK